MGWIFDRKWILKWIEFWNELNFARETYSNLFQSIPIYSNLSRKTNKNHCQPIDSTIDRPRPRTLCLPPAWGTVPSLKLISRCVYVPFSSLPSHSFSFFPFRLSLSFISPFLFSPSFLRLFSFFLSYIRSIVYALLFTQFFRYPSFFGKFFLPSFLRLFSRFFRLRNFLDFFLDSPLLLFSVFSPFYFLRPLLRLLLRPLIYILPLILLFTPSYLYSSSIFFHFFPSFLRSLSC